MTPKAILFLVLGVLVCWYAYTWMQAVRAEGKAANPVAVIAGVILGAVFGWMAGGGVAVVGKAPDQHLQINGFVHALTEGAAPAFDTTILVSTVVFAFVGLAAGMAYAGLRPSAIEYFVGFVTNFFDTLGIGSYAPTTAMFRAWKLTDDRVIPGTLNVGHYAPTLAEAFIFIAIIEVDFTTLALLLAASVVGAWLGAGVVAKWPRRYIQVGMGFCLLGAAMLMLSSILGITAAGGTATALTGLKLGIGFVGSMFLGALMTLGIGFYAPCLIMISLLGMNPVTAFPIMMGACAFLMPAAAVKFIKEKSYAPKPALALTVAGTPAVLIAAFIVKSLSLTYVRWLVVLVVLFTSISMLRAARMEPKPSGSPAAT